MKKMHIGLIILVCLSAISVSGAAGSDNDERMMVRVPYEFTAGDKALPAGRYSVSTEPGTPIRLHIHDRTGETCAWLPVITRLAMEGHGDDKPRLVFDRVGGQRLLSEVWLGGEDGYLVRGTPKEHSHEIVQFGE